MLTKCPVTGRSIPPHDYNKVVLETEIYLNLSEPCYVRGKFVSTSEVLYGSTRKGKLTEKSGGDRRSSAESSDIER